MPEWPSSVFRENQAVLSIFACPTLVCALLCKCDFSTFVNNCLLPKHELTHRAKTFRDALLCDLAPETLVADLSS